VIAMCAGSLRACRDSSGSPWRSTAPRCAGGSSTPRWNCCRTGPRRRHDGRPGHPGAGEPLVALQPLQQGGRRRRLRDRRDLAVPGAAERVAGQPTRPTERLETYVRPHVDPSKDFHIGPGPELRAKLSPESAMAMREHVVAVEQVLPDPRRRCGPGRVRGGRRRRHRLAPARDPVRPARLDRHHHAWRGGLRSLGDPEGARPHVAAFGVGGVALDQVDGDVPALLAFGLPDPCPARRCVGAGHALGGDDGLALLLLPGRLLGDLRTRLNAAGTNATGV
jgi:hypothetical protein